MTGFYTENDRKMKINKLKSQTLKSRQYKNKLWKF